MKSYGTYSFEIVLATKAVYYIEAIVNKGTGKERSKNEKIYVYGEIEETKQEEEDTRETVVDALKKAIDQGILGNYYEEEATLGGIAAQVVIGFIPYVGQVADVRDISEDVLNWEWSWEHFSYTVFDSIAIIPGFDCLKGLKHTDELYVIVKRGEKEMLLLIDKVDDVTKKLLKGDKIIGYAAKNGDEIVTAGVKESKKTVGEIVKENADDVVESGSKTGTVWDKITSTADNMPATEIPATFKVDLTGNINYVNPETGTNSLWTNSNATKHMGEYVSRFGEESWSIGTRSQAMLESYYESLNKAMETIGTETPGRYFGTYGDWELGINTETGVVYHARMIN